MLKLSIIIPMYNVAPYVDKCIRLLENQDIPHSEYEIICVNDGSPDTCKEIVQRLQKEYSNIVLIDQENQGVSRARNNAIDIAKGEYILFIDPDDYVDSNSFKRVLSTADGSFAEITFLGYTILNEDRSVRIRVFNEVNRGHVYSGIDAYFIARGNGKTDPDRLWAVLIERKFIETHSLKFLSDVPYLEDGELMARMMCLAERCVFDGYSFYQRTTRPGSATNSKLFYSERAVDGFIKAALHLKEFQQNPVLSPSQRFFLNQPIVKFTLLVVLPFCEVRYIFKYRQSVLLLKKYDLMDFEINGCNKEYFHLGQVFLKSPLKFFFVKLLRL